MFLKDGLKGKSFLDIGCGSGLSFLAAYNLGAKSITSVDIDPLNIENTNSLKNKFNISETFPWKVRITNIVSNDDVKDLPKSDVVYSWGVLHHTGVMWSGITNTISLVNPEGLLYLMLYRNAHLARV